MATALQVMKQIWELENIWVEIRSKKTDLPKYSFQRSFSKHSTVANWIKSRLNNYDRSLIDVRKDNGEIASEKTKIDSLRNSYRNITIELIESKFTVELDKKRIKKIKEKQEIATKEAESIKVANNTISKTKCDVEEILEHYEIVDKYAKHVCCNIKTVINKLCRDNDISTEICSKIADRIEEELHMSKLRDALTQVYDKKKNLNL